MNSITIHHHRTKTVLFTGRFPSLRHCVEQAVRDHVCLDFADFSRANLVNAALDEGKFRRARFRDANLMGANMSEACLDGADFTNAGLQNACLCQSSLRHCRFDGTLFGATDITGSILDRSLFSTLSAFHLDFTGTESMRDCLYADPAGAVCGLSEPPLVLTGLANPVIVMDHHVKIGGWLGTHADCLKLLDSVGEDDGMQAFIQGQRDYLVSLLSLKACETGLKRSA